MNHVTLMGNLTRDPEVKQTGSGTALCSFSVAVNRQWKDASGEKKEEVSFIDCDAWGKTAENIARFFGKGRQILVEGRLKQETWEDKGGGGKRSKLKVVVDTFHFTSSGKGEGGGAPGQGVGSGRAAPPAADEIDVPF